MQNLSVYIGGASKTQGNASVGVDLSSARVDTTTLGLNTTTTNINGTVTMQAIGAVNLNSGNEFLANTSQSFQIPTGSIDQTFTIGGETDGLTKDQFLTAINAQLAGTGVAASVDLHDGCVDPRVVQGVRVHGLGSRCPGGECGDQRHLRHLHGQQLD